jgi:hypothetical protein
MFHRCLLLASAALCAATPAVAQPLTVTCIPAPRPPAATAAENACRQEMATRSGPEIVRVRVTEIRDGVPRPVRAGVNVSFVPTSGGVSHQTVVADEDGYAMTTWSGETRNDTVGIAVLAHVGDRTGSARFLLQAAPEPATARLVLPPPGRYGFEERQLRHPVRVAVVGPDEARCPAQRVAFRPIGTGAVASPDTARAEWDVQQGTCVAETYWTLARGVGHQSMIATVAGQPTTSQTYRARARARPRILMGIAGSILAWDEYTRMAADTTRVTVAHRFEDVVVFRDTLVIERRPVQKRRETAYHPVIGVDFPAIEHFGRLRTVVATSARDPRNNLYLGASILQPVWGFAHEGLGVDLHGFVHIQRRQVVTDVAVCAAPGPDCPRDWRTAPVALGLLLSLDGATVFTRLLDALVP